MGKVIYLTGSPATGKSTLCKNLEATVPRLLSYSYSKLLRDYVNERREKNIDEEDIRKNSSKIITKADVEAVDKWLIKDVQTKRDKAHVVIDSHAVTKESYGFRTISFGIEQLAQLNPDVIVCLYVSPMETKRRIVANPAGRPLPSEFEIALHVELQAALAAQYAFQLGKPCYLLDSSTDQDELKDSFCRVSEIL